MSRFEDEFDDDFEDPEAVTHIGWGGPAEVAEPPEREEAHTGETTDDAGRAASVTWSTTRDAKVPAGPQQPSRVDTAPRRIPQDWIDGMTAEQKLAWIHQLSAPSDQRPER